jgi:hypothetical protein
MAQNKGTLLVSPIRPINGDLNIPVAYAEEIRGGWHSVDAISDRDLISEGRRKFGMIVYVKNDDKFFQLKQTNSPSLNDNLNWNQINLVQSGSEWVNSVLSKQGTPPMSPSNGDRYLIDVGTGVWTAHSNKIAEYLNTSWIYTTPTEGMTVRIDNEPGPIYSYLGGIWTKQEFVGDAQYPYYIVPNSANLNVATGSEYLIYGDLTLNGNINNNGKVVVLNGNISGGGTISGSGLIQQVNLLTDVIAGPGITISSTSSSTRTVSTNIIAGTGIYISNNGNQLDISSLPQLVSPSYVIQANEKIVVPDWKEYFIYGDLTVYGELDIADDGKVVVVNGNFISATGATVTNMGNIELYQLVTAADDNLKVDITEIRYGSAGRILYESPLKWMPLYGTYARVLTEDSNFVYTTSSAYLTSTASSFENYMGVGTSDPLKKLHIHNSGLLIDGSVSEQEAGLGDPNFARLVINSESSELHSLIDARNDYGTVLHVKGNIEGGNRFPSVSIGTPSTTGLFQVNDYYGLNSLFINRSGNIGLHTLSPSFSTHIVGDVQLDLGGDSNYDMFIRGTNSKLERIPHGLPNQVFKIPADGATPSWSNFSGGGGSASVSIDTNEVAFGTGTGITSSNSFRFYSSSNSLNSGYNSGMTFSYCSSILGGQSNCISASQMSSIIGGSNNNVKVCSQRSSIIGGQCNTIGTQSQQSVILGGYCNCIQYSNKSIIGGGEYNSMNSSIFSSIISGFQNKILNASQYSSIIGGRDNKTCISSFSVLIGGRNNTISSSSCSNSIGGYSNNINSINSSIINGSYNTINNGSDRSLISGGSYNIITNGSSNSLIINGLNNTIMNGSLNSSIMVGSNNIMCNGACCSLIIGSNNSDMNNGVMRSVIISSNLSKIQNGACDSIINGGTCHRICFGSQNTFIGGGFMNDACGVESSSIIGGHNNQITCNTKSSIMGGFCNYILVSDQSSIIGGEYNIISWTSSNSSIIGGCYNTMTASAHSSSIIGGDNNYNRGAKSSIVGGRSNSIILSNYSSIIGGLCNMMTTSSKYSSILGGYKNNMTQANDSLVFGRCNIVTSSNNTSILGGFRNCIISSNSSPMLGGYFNSILSSSIFSSMIGGYCGNISSSNYSSIIGGKFNSMTQSNASAILSSCNIRLVNSCNTNILGINSISGLTFSNRCNDTIVQDFVVTGSMSTIISSNEFFGITGTFSSPTQIVVKNGIIISIT